MIEFIENPFPSTASSGTGGQWDSILIEKKGIQPDIHLSAWNRISIIYLIYFSIPVLNWIYPASIFFEYRPKLESVLQRKPFHACTPYGKQIEPESHPLYFEWHG